MGSLTLRDRVVNIRDAEGKVVSSIPYQKLAYVLALYQKPEGIPSNEGLFDWVASELGLLKGTVTGESMLNLCHALDNVKKQFDQEVLDKTRGRFEVQEEPTIQDSVPQRESASTHAFRTQMAFPSPDECKLLVDFYRMLRFMLFLEQREFAVEVFKRAGFNKDQVRAEIESIQQQLSGYQKG